MASTPWTTALSAEITHQRLLYYQSRGKGAQSWLGADQQLTRMRLQRSAYCPVCPAGLLPGGLDGLTGLLRGPDAALLPQGSAWVLLLALGLLCELRDPRSRCAAHAPHLAYCSGTLLLCHACFTGGCLLRSLRWAPYVTMLPAPPGSRVAAVCRAGPPASDLLLFRHARGAAWLSLACMHAHEQSPHVTHPTHCWHVCSAEELDELQSPLLAAAVRAERARLRRLHAHLFGKGEDANVSLESFLWAHCLVRSRALELSAPAQQVCALYCIIGSGLATRPSLKLMRTANAQMKRPALQLLLPGPGGLPGALHAAADRPVQPCRQRQLLPPVSAHVNNRTAQV